MAAVCAIETQTSSFRKQTLFDAMNAIIMRRHSFRLIGSPLPLTACADTLTVHTHTHIYNAGLSDEIITKQ